MCIPIAGLTLWPNPEFLPKVLSNLHLNQPIQLARFDPPGGEGDEKLVLLCPVRALRAYVDSTVGLRQSDQLFVCFAPSKQHLSNWIVDVICHAYKTGGRPLPSGVRCHSVRSVSTSCAALRGVPLEAICAAAWWASPSTFARFYRVIIASPHPLGVVIRPSSSASSQ